MKFLLVLLAVTVVCGSGNLKSVAVPQGLHSDERINDRGKESEAQKGGYGRIEDYGLQRVGYGSQRSDYGPQRDGYGGQKDGYGPQNNDHGRQKESYNYGPQQDAYGPPRDGLGLRKEDYGYRADDYRRGQDGYPYLIIGRHGLGFTNRYIWASGLMSPITAESLQKIGKRDPYEGPYY